MITRFLRAIRAIFIGGTIAANPVKGITALVISIIIPYLLYAFLGGAAFVLVIAGVIALVWWMAKKDR
ncbi:MAG: hypothetical protein U5J95_06640 [Balneolaceae bacterium]|nr:hypothetical protein [Balneolaceae bacterium]